MLKRLAAILIALSITLTISTVADASTTLKTSQIISDVAYDEFDGQLYIYTVRASDGSFWVLDIELKKGETLKQLNKRLKGHKVDIYYVLVDGESEIIKTVVG